MRQRFDRVSKALHAWCQTFDEAYEATGRDDELGDASDALERAYKVFDPRGR